MGAKAQGAIFLLFACAGTAAAQQDYPVRPVRVVVGIAPGGGLDIMTRLGAQKLSERWGKTVVVDNRPGGGTVLAMDIVVQAPADGYTLLAASDTFVLNAVFRRTKYDVRKSFMPIAQLTTQPYALVVHPSLPAKSVKELIALAKAKPGALSFGSQGMGTTGHIGWERFNHMAGVSIVHVPYKGAAPAVIDVISGQIQMTFSNFVTSGVHLKSGKLRGLAYTGARRTPLAPDLPTVSEAGVPGFELANSYAYYAPAGTPRGVVREINAILVQGMNSLETRKALAVDGSEPVAPATPEAFGAKLDRQLLELEKLVKAANIKLH